MTEPEILVGYVNFFNFQDQHSEAILQGHPKKGRVYQLIKDEEYGYRLHIGRENTKEQLMEGILLGTELSGDHDEKWHFDIAVVNQDNFLDFDISQEDAKKLEYWFQTGNQELKETLTKPTRVVAADSEGNIIGDPKELVSEDELNALTITGALNTLYEQDREFFKTTTSLLSYLKSCYEDTLEKGTLGLDSTEFLLNAETHEPTLHVTIDCLQQYINKKDSQYLQIGKLYQAIDYLLLEITRRSRQNGK